MELCPTAALTRTRTHTHTLRHTHTHTHIHTHTHTYTYTQARTHRRTQEVSSSLETCPSPPLRWSYSASFSNFFVSNRLSFRIDLNIGNVMHRFRIYTFIIIIVGIDFSLPAITVIAIDYRITSNLSIINLHFDAYFQTH